jgi:hypothetical protein
VQTDQLQLPGVRRRGRYPQSEQTTTWCTWKQIVVWVILLVALIWWILLQELEPLEEDSEL